MEIKYTSTRDKNVIVSPSKAIVTGLSHEGGLFVPTSFPKLDKSLDELSKMDYKNVAYEVMKLFLMTINLIQMRLFLYQRLIMLIMWNCSTAQP